jgi:hypothetical protein
MLRLKEIIFESYDLHFLVSEELSCRGETISRDLKMIQERCCTSSFISLNLSNNLCEAWNIIPTLIFM